MTIINYDQVLADMQSLGLLIDRIEIGSERVERCRVRDGDREKRGWYRLSEFPLNEDACLVGAYGIYRGNNPNTVRVTVPRGIQDRLSESEREAIAARIKADQAKAKAARAAEQERASASAAAVWRRYVQAGRSAYLERKGVGPHGVRFHPTADTLAIPLCDGSGKVWALELIRGADRGDKPEKQYWPKGCKTHGLWHLIGGSPRDILLVTEGYATGASLLECTGLPVAVAFSAVNLVPSCIALKRLYPAATLILCADDDYRTDGNPGVTQATAAALAVHGHVLAPVFASERAQSGRKGPTDFNDLHTLEGAQAVRSQVETLLSGLGLLAPRSTARGLLTKGGGEIDPTDWMPSRISVDEAALRYRGTYGLGGKVLFDCVDRRLVTKDDVVNLLPRHGWDQLKDHPDWAVVRDTEIDFDPSQKDPRIKCNLFDGWPITPAEGDCSALLELLQFMLCRETDRFDVLYHWVLNWLAYPLQHPGAKMHTALVLHGEQGTGKNLFFEAYAKIFGRYALTINQAALEDKFNADWLSSKLFIVADEVVARQDAYHIKNQLKNLITGQTVRVNPKGITAHTETNHINFVFLSNELRPLILEKGDRRHAVIYTPEPSDEAFYKRVVAEIDNGGVAALYHYLLNRPLGDFTQASKPPETSAKADLVIQSISNEQRFIDDWLALEIDNANGTPVPVVPVQSADLYSEYRRWCQVRGERERRSQDLIAYCQKRPGWKVGALSTYNHLRDASWKKRRMIVPSERDIEAAVQRDSTGSANQERWRRQHFDSDGAWYTAGLFHFQDQTDRLRQ